jgi:hypothetical protein
MQEVRLPIPDERPQMDKRMKLIKCLLNFSFLMFRDECKGTTSVPRLVLTVVMMGQGKWVFDLKA